MVTIQLTAEEIAVALRLADASYEVWKNETGHYGDNHLRRHQTGKIGEMAVARYVEDAGIQCDRAFTDPNREGEADIITACQRIEVKTWSARWWDAGGRCVTPAQLPHIQANADVVAWCTVVRTVHDGLVELHGWSTVAEVSGAAGVENHQVPEAELRPVDDLLARARG